MWRRTPLSGLRQHTASLDSRETHFQAVWKMQPNRSIRKTGTRVQEAIQQVLNGKESQYASQYRVVRPDGSICWIDARGVIVRDPSAHMLGIGVDITDIKKVEESLHESEENYLLLLNSTAVAIYGIDLNGDCTFCNPPCCTSPWLRKAGRPAWRVHAHDCAPLLRRRKFVPG